MVTLSLSLEGWIVSELSEKGRSLALFQFSHEAYSMLSQCSGYLREMGELGVCFLILTMGRREASASRALPEVVLHRYISPSERPGLSAQLGASAPVGGPFLWITSLRR